MRSKATGSVHVASGSSGSILTNDKRMAYNHDIDKPRQPANNGTITNYDA